MLYSVCWVMRGWIVRCRALTPHLDGTARELRVRARLYVPVAPASGLRSVKSGEAYSPKMATCVVAGSASLPHARTHPDTPYRNRLPAWPSHDQGAAQHDTLWATHWLLPTEDDAGLAECQCHHCRSIVFLWRGEGTKGREHGPLAWLPSPRW